MYFEHLTLTNVVFESRNGKRIHLGVYNLTLTNVVFE